MNSIVPLLLAFAALVGDAPPTARTSSVPSAAPARPVEAVDTAATAKLDPCTYLAADATATLVRFDQSVAVESNGVSYRARKRECRRFIGEIQVPSNALGPSGGLSGSTPWYEVTGQLVAMQTEQSKCAATKMVVTIYQRPAGASAFQFRTNTTYQGSWSPPGNFGPRCDMVRVSGQEPPKDEPNPAGAEVWRVIIDASTNGSPLAVQANVAFGIVPY